METLRLGVLADTSIHLNELQELVAACGYELVLADQPRNVRVSELPDADAWVVRLDLNNSASLKVYEQLEASEKPVIFDDLEAWEGNQTSERNRRFARKIALCIGRDGQVGRGQHTRAKYLWVIAASTGGPEAVNQFLQALGEPPAGLAMVYVQHIDANINASLLRSLSRNSQWRVVTGDVSQPILDGSLYLLSPSHQVEISDTGMLVPQQLGWNGPFRPSANQVIAKVARTYGNRGGAIVFSGMGDDGAQSCPYLKGCGGKVWVQTPATCTVDSMPTSVLAADVVDFEGSPEELARELRRVLTPAEPLVSDNANQN